MRLVAEDVCKQFGSVRALDGLSVVVPEGTTFGVLGMNGAGKTTLFELMVGLDVPDSGRLTIGGRDVAEAGDSIRREVGYLPERIGFPGALTGREVLEFHARMRGLDDPDRIEEALEVVGLDGGDAGRAVAGYSNGMRRRLGLGAAVLSRPAVLILDEPTAGLDPRGVVEFHRIIDRARTRTDATVVLASHVLSEIEKLCDRVAILDAGRIVAEGTVHELTSAEEVTVQLWPASGADLENLERIVDRAGATSTTAEALSVSTPTGRIPALLAKVHGEVELEDVAIRRRGLEAAFHRAFETDSADRDDQPTEELV